KGVSAVQVFDSWGGSLSPEDYQIFSWPYINQIVEALAPLTHVVVFGKGCWFALEEMTLSKASALGVDWTVRPELARMLTNHTISLKMRFKPDRLNSSRETITIMVTEMNTRIWKNCQIGFLGDVILPSNAVDTAYSFCRAVV